MILLLFVSIEYHPRYLGHRLTAGVEREATGLFNGAPVFERLEEIVGDVRVNSIDSGAPFINVTYDHRDMPKIQELLPFTTRALLKMQSSFSKEYTSDAVQSFTINWTEPECWIPTHLDIGDFDHALAATITSQGIFRTHTHDEPYAPTVQAFMVRRGDMVDISGREPHSAENIGNTPRISLATQF